MPWQWALPPIADRFRGLEPLIQAERRGNRDLRFFLGSLRDGGTRPLMHRGVLPKRADGGLLRPDLSPEESFWCGTQPRSAADGVLMG